VYKVLDENIKLGHADYACYWTLELLCSGLVHSLWQTLFEASAHHINRAAPNVFLYLVRMYEKFSPYEGQYSIMAMTDMRNNMEIRNLVCEVSASIAMLRKNKLPPLPTIKPEHDFNTTTINENLKAPSSNYARHLIKEDDPLDLYVPINELCYCLLDCSFRVNSFIEDAHCRHVVWLLWNVIIDSVRSSPQAGVLMPYIDSLYKLHCLRWTPTTLKSRICFMTTAIVFICDSNTLDIHYPVPQNIMQVKGLIENIPQWIQSIIQTQKTFSS
jgi:hypothetical protein